MKKLATLLLMLLPLMASAQIRSERITSVCGVHFGANYEPVEKILKKKFGKPSPWSEKGKVLSYSNVTYEGVTYDYIEFSFYQGEYGPNLDEVQFYKSKLSKWEANELLKAMSQKYKLYEEERLAETDDLFMYYGGISPVDNTKYAFRILISRLDDGSYSYDLTYGPYLYYKFKEQ